MPDMITDHITKYIYATGNAHYAVQDNTPGVVFHDEGEFIPLQDLAYSERLGFFRRSLFPAEPAIAEYVPYYEVRPVVSRDPWDAYAIVDTKGEYGYLLGEPWEMLEAYYALKRAVEGVFGEPIDENDDAMGRGLWLTTSEAAERLHRLDPDEYPLLRKTYVRLRHAGEEGRVHAVRSERHGWRFHAHSLDDWAADDEAHRPGVKATIKKFLTGK